MDLRQQLKEKNEDICRHCEKEKGLEEKIEKQLKDLHLWVGKNYS